MWCDVMWCDMAWRDIKERNAMQCDVTWREVTWSDLTHPIAAWRNVRSSRLTRKFCQLIRNEADEESDVNLPVKMIDSSFKPRHYSSTRYLEYLLTIILPLQSANQLARSLILTNVWPRWTGDSDRRRGAASRRTQNRTTINELEVNATRSCLLGARGSGLRARCSVIARS